MKQCEGCQITGTDDCDLIYEIYLADGDTEIMIEMCYLCAALIQSHLPSMED